MRNSQNGQLDFLDAMEAMLVRQEIGAFGFVALNGVVVILQMNRSCTTSSRNKLSVLRKVIQVMRTHQGGDITFPTYLTGKR